MKSSNPQWLRLIVSFSLLTLMSCAVVARPTEPGNSPDKSKSCPPAPQFNGIDEKLVSRVKEIHPGFTCVDQMRRGDQIVSLNFDWDDNTFNMPSPIVISNYGGVAGRQEYVSTEEFAIIKRKLGMCASEPIERNDTTFSDFYGSAATPAVAFRFMGDAPADDKQWPNTNYFLEYIKVGVTGQNPLKLPVVSREDWHGPAWGAFATSVSNPVAAHCSSLITARGQSENSTMAGLNFLKSSGNINHVPDVQNIFAVSNPKYGGGVSAPGPTKAAVMVWMLDQIQANSLEKSRAIPVIARDLVNADAHQRFSHLLHPKREPLHIWAFSDDDYDNIKVAAEVLSYGVKNGRWNDVKIMIFFTGAPGSIPKADQIVATDKIGNVVSIKSKLPRVMVVQSNGMIRPALAMEEFDFPLIAAHMFAEKQK